MVDEEFAFDMVELVLHHAGEITVNPFVMLLKIFVEIAHMYSFCASNIFM